MLPQVERPGTLEKVITALQAVLRFLGPFENAAGWAVLVLTAPWQHVNSVGLYQGDAKFSYRLDPLGRVWLRGGVENSTGAGVIVGTLPPECRPKHVVYFPAGGNFVVFPSGVVSYEGALPGSIYMDGTSFDTEA